VWFALSLNGPGAILDPGNDLRRRFGCLKLLLFVNQSGGGFEKVSVLLDSILRPFLVNFSIRFCFFFFTLIPFSFDLDIGVRSLLRLKLGSDC
jgi:hypothetical protein